MKNAIARRDIARCRRIGSRISIATLATGLLALFGAPVTLADDAQDAVEDLPVCYARGTDTLGSAVNAVGGQPLDSTVNLADPTFARAVGIYRRCFADGFSFTLKIDNVPIVTVPDPGTVTPDTDEALQWANFVNNAFRGPGYKNTQHHMGSISSSVHGGSATIVSYLIATHSYGPTSALTGVQIVGGTYKDNAVRLNGRWFLQNRTLNITSSVNVPASQ
jgi:hypothetical protein